MNEARTAAIVCLVVAVLVVLGGVTLWFATGNPSRPSSISRGTSGGSETFLNLTIAYDPSTGMATYTTPNVTMIAHTTVVVTITNHDPTHGNLYVPWDTQVIGTVGGTELIESGGGWYSAQSLPTGGVSHTFTVLDSLYNISVPIPPATSPTAPTVVTFELTPTTAENTTWACMCDCQNGHMMVGMYGRLTINE
jgi:hypothetical protein